VKIDVLGLLVGVLDVLSLDGSAGPHLGVESGPPQQIDPDPEIAALGGEFRDVLEGVPGDDAVVEAPFDPLLEDVDDLGLVVDGEVDILRAEDALDSGVEFVDDVQRGIGGDDDDTDLRPGYSSWARSSE